MGLPTGHILNGRYRIDSQIGQGSLGAVYAAWDTNLNMPVAVKEQGIASPEAVRRFTRQARALAGLRHLGLPYVIDHFSLPEQGQYLVTEFVNGQNLQSLAVQQAGGLSEHSVLPWFIEVCDALSYLHQQDPPVLHRDVKPANIRITPQGHAVLVDYGIGPTAAPADPPAADLPSADPAQQPAAALPPAPGPRPSSNPFSAPEAGQPSADGRADLYALAASLYAVLCACPPLSAAARQSGGELTPPRRLNPGVSTTCEAAIQQALQLDPQRRFQSLAAFKEALRSAQRAALPPAQVDTLVMPPAAASAAATLHSPPTFPATQKAPEPVLAAAPYAAAHGPVYSASAPTAYVAGPFVDAGGFPPGAPPPDRYIPLPAEPGSSRRAGLPLALLIPAGLLACLVLVGAIGLGAWLVLSAGRAASTAGPALNAAATLTAEAPSPAAGSPTAVSPTASHTPAPTAAPSATLTATWTAAPASPTFTLPPSLTPSYTPTPVQSNWQPCPGTYFSRLHVGDTASVSQDPPLPNRMRAQPNTASTILGFIQPGEQVSVIGGPVCSNEWIWWQVKSLHSGLSGWTAEGDSGGYWLVPEN
ncbi:MAG: protein kinase domain-containing protein [Chloroflexota bacterium]